MKILSLMLLSLFFLSILPAQQNDNENYVKGYQLSDIDKTINSIGMYPENGSDLFKLDEDFFITSFALRKIGESKNVNNTKNKYSTELITSMANRTKEAWDYDDVYYWKELLDYYLSVKNLSHTTEKTIIDSPKKQKIFQKYMQTVLDCKDRSKNIYNRIRPWKSFYMNGITPNGYDEENVWNVFINAYPKDVRTKYSLAKKDLSYPSGHALMAYASAMYFCKVSGANKEETYAYLLAAHKLAMSRVILGVHHYSDIQASYRLAKEIIMELEKKDEFKKDLDKLGGTFKNNEFNISNLPKQITYIEEDLLIAAKKHPIKLYCMEHEKYFDIQTDPNGILFNQQSNRIYTFNYECSEHSKCRFMPIFIEEK